MNKWQGLVLHNEIGTKKKDNVSCERFHSNHVWWMNINMYEKMFYSLTFVRNNILWVKYELSKYDDKKTIIIWYFEFFCSCKQSSAEKNEIDDGWRYVKCVWQRLVKQTCSETNVCQKITWLVTVVIIIFCFRWINFVYLLI